MTTTYFKDSKDRTWDLAMNLAAAKRIDASDFTLIYPKKFSILSPHKELFMDILRHDALMCAIVWAIIQPQVKKLFIAGNWPVDPDPKPHNGETVEEFETRIAASEECFTEALSGPVITQCRETLWRALGDFFPVHQTVLSTLLTRYTNAQQRMNQKLAEMGPELDALMNDTIDLETDNLRKKLVNLKGKTVAELRGELSSELQQSFDGTGESLSD